MKFTEDFVSLPIYVNRKDGDSTFISTLKTRPSGILGWFKYDDDITTAFISGYGAVSIEMNVDDFEKLVNDFVGEPVTAQEKTVAMMGRLVDKLNED